MDKDFHGPTCNLFEEGLEKVGGWKAGAGEKRTESEERKSANFYVNLYSSVIQPAEPEISPVPTSPKGVIDSPPLPVY